MRARSRGGARIRARVGAGARGRRRSGAGGWRPATSAWLGHGWREKNPRETLERDSRNSSQSQALQGKRETVGSQLSHI